MAGTESPLEVSSTSRDISVSDLLSRGKMRSSPWTRELFHLPHGKAFSSNMFKERIEIEFRVSDSESLVLAVQLFQKAFHVCCGVHGPHLMHRR